jgi:phosphoribosylformimino-5-aminoimidazole carboxamide ribotide isomerase
MIVAPAIDVRAGRVVRLRQGQLEEEKVYGADPAVAARRWADEGAPRLHVVDLDAAIVGHPQYEVVGRVIDAVRVPVEVGGGIRTLEAAERLVGRGADRVIFGTAAVADPAVVQEAARRWPGKVAVAFEARGGRVAVAGFHEITRVEATELAQRVKGWGIPRIQYTDVLREGALAGPNAPAIEALARGCGLRVTVAGGVTILEDLTRLKEIEPAGVDEVVIGKALYEERFTLAQAMEALA